MVGSIQVVKRFESGKVKRDTCDDSIIWETCEQTVSTLKILSFRGICGVLPALKTLQLVILYLTVNPFTFFPCTCTLFTNVEIKRNRVISEILRVIALLIALRDTKLIGHELYARKVGLCSQVTEDYTPVPIYFMAWHPFSLPRRHFRVISESRVKRL